MIKIYLPNECRDYHCKRIALDKYPKITVKDTQYILSKIDIRESLTEDPFGNVTANEY